MKKINSSTIYKTILSALGIACITIMLGTVGYVASRTNYFQDLQGGNVAFDETEEFTQLVERDLSRAVYAQTSVKYFNNDDQNISILEFLEMQGGYKSLVSALGGDYLDINKDILYEWACAATSSDKQDTVYEYFDREHNKYYLSDTYYGEIMKYRLEQIDDGKIQPFTEIKFIDDKGREISNADELDIGTFYYIENIDLKGIFSTKFVDGRSIVEITNQAGGNEAYYQVVEALPMLLPKYKEIYEGYKSSSSLNTTASNFKWLIVDQNNGFLYTNHVPFCDYARALEYVDESKKHEKYLVYYDSNTCNGTISGMDEIAAGLTKTFGDDLKGLIVCGFVDETAEVDDEYQAGWYKYSQINTAYDQLESVLVVFGIALFVILLLSGISAGHKKGYEGEIYLNGFDKLPTGLAVAIIIGLEFILTYLTALPFWANNRSTMPSDLSVGIFSVYGLLSGLLFFAGFNSLVKRFKADTFFKNSIIGWIIKGIIALNNLLAGVVPGRVRGTVVFAVALIFNVIAAGNRSAGLFILALIADIGLVVYVLIYLSSVDKIKKSLKDMRSGENLAINTKGMPSDAREIAEDVNSMQDMIKSAVARSIADEKMKVDLITNVSHDLKTPLTSIITYIDLLKKEVDDNEKAQEYISVLEQKSARLKQLTEDVVEASKASSGNIQLEKTILDFVEIIHQVDGETKEKFEKSDLAVIENLATPPVRVNTDGRYLYRVLENLYNNAAKYALPGTRVYVELYVVDNMARFSIKNISKEPLSITPEELKERFVRGDSSRNTEGSGLGLSIAASLTQNLGGQFDIRIDGDLFRVDVELPIAQD